MATVIVLRFLHQQKLFNPQFEERYVREQSEKKVNHAVKMNCPRASAHLVTEKGQKRDSGDWGKVSNPRPPLIQLKREPVEQLSLLLCLISM